MNKHLLLASVVALAITAQVAAHAYEPGDFFVRSGVAHVQP
ncbi:outer membrane protein OmpW, partial [Pseudomonas syringae pv. tagetis]